MRKHMHRFPQRCEEKKQVFPPLFAYHITHDGHVAARHSHAHVRLRQEALDVEAYVDANLFVRNRTGQDTENASRAETDKETRHMIRSTYVPYHSRCEGRPVKQGK